MADGFLATLDSRLRGNDEEMLALEWNSIVQSP